jgi:hypothetical protein
MWQPKQHQNSTISNVSCKDKTYWGTTSLYYKENIIQWGNVDLAHILFEDQVVDILIKALRRIKFQGLRNKLGIVFLNNFFKY